MDLKLKDHLWYLWHFLRTRQFVVFRTAGTQRLLGPSHVWYDGPHYAFGFWFFTVAAYYQDDPDQLAKLNLYGYIDRLLKAK